MNKIQNEKGQGLVEYGLILALVSTVIVGTLGGIGDSVMNTFIGVDVALSNNKDVFVINGNEHIQFGEHDDIHTTMQDYNGLNLVSANPDSWIQGGIDEDGSIWDTQRRITLDESIVIPLDVRSISGTVPVGYSIIFGEYIDGRFVKRDYWLYDKFTVNLHEQTNHVKITVRKNKESNISPKEIGDMNIKLEYGPVVTMYQPSPRDLLHAKEYRLSGYFENNKKYRLLSNTEGAEWVGVWLGNDHFVGYLDNDGAVSFNGTVANRIVIKSIDPESYIQDVRVITQ